MNKLTSLLKLGNIPYSAISRNSINLFKTCTQNYGTSRIKKVPINSKPGREISKRFTRCEGCKSCRPVKQQNVKKEEQICPPAFNYDSCKPAKKIPKTNECDIIMAKSCKSNPCQFGCINAPTTDCTNVCPAEKLPPVPKGNWKKSDP